MCIDFKNMKNASDHILIRPMIQDSNVLGSGSHFWHSSLRMTCTLVFIGGRVRTNSNNCIRRGIIQYIWRETMIYFVLYINIMKDISKVVDYLKVGSPHHVRSYLWWWGEKSNNFIRGGGEIEKTLH